MKKFFIALVLVLLLSIPFKAVADDFKAYLIPWVVTSENWWSGLNIKNLSNRDVNVTIKRYSENGSSIMGTEELLIPGYGNRRWVVNPNVRSIVIEGNDSIFITAFLGTGVNSTSGLTELKIYDITSIKN